VRAARKATAAAKRSGGGMKARRARAEKLAVLALEALGDDPEALKLVADLVTMLASRSPIRRRRV